MTMSTITLALIASGSPSRTRNKEHTMDSHSSRREFLATAGAGLAAGITAFAPNGSAAPAKGKAGIRVGLDMDKQPSAIKKQGPIALLNFVKENGFDGAYFRLMLDLSPTLDEVQLKEIKAHADSLGLFLGAGIGWMNPYNTAERPEIRRFGGGDYRLA